MTTATLLILILAGLGIVNTTYLSYHAINKTLVKCFFFPPEWCEKVQKSKQSKFLGLIPNAYLGLGMYIALFATTYLAHIDIISELATIIIIAIGFLFSTYFLYVQAFVLKAFCTYCVISAIDFSLLVLIILFL